MARIYSGRSIIILLILLQSISGCGEPGNKIKEVSNKGDVVRANITRLSGKAGGQDEIEPLVLALRDKHPQFRLSAAEALGKTGNARAAEPLIEALADSNAGVRRAATTALVNIGDAAKEPLIKTLQDEDSDVRDASANILDKMGWKPQTEHETILYLTAKRKWDELIQIGPAGLESVVKSLGDKASWIREYAAKALNKVNWKPQTQQERIQYLIAEKKWKSLIRIGSPAVGSLIKTLKYRHWRDRGRIHEKIIETLGAIGDKEAVKPLIKHLEDIGAPARDAAAKALGQIGDKEAMNALIKALSSSQTAAAAARALGQIGDKKAVEPLIKALQGNRPDLKAAAAVALGEMGDPRAVEPLIKEFRSRKKSWGGTATAIALGRIGDKRAIGPLTEALADEEAYVREAAATALDNIGVEPKGLQDRLTYLIASGNREELIKIGQPAVKPLMESLAFHDWKGCILAADVLGQIGDPAAVEPLIKVLEHENSNVRAAAAKALIEIPDRRAMQPLERTLGDWDAGPNAAAALEALGWKPKTDEQRIIFLVANRDKQGLLESWEQTRKVLLAEARSDDKKRINNAVGAFISIGKEEDVDDLINILMNYGEKEMAIMFLNCGNERLAAAAKFWAKEMGYLVLPFASRSSSVSWGR